MALQPGDEFAGYRIISLLGRGGMGQVYLVENPHLRRREALKVISTAGAHDPDFQRRFTQEAQTAAALSHPAIVTIYHYGVEDESPWFTMEHLDGANPTHQSLTVDEVIEVTGHVAAALDYAHRRHVVHRDIKPANIIVLRDDEGAIERAVVLDFGIAKLLNSTGLTASSAFIGTLAYTAPEIIDGQPASPASDQYALACTVYELLSGAAPFRDTTPSAVMMAHIIRPSPPLKELNPALARFDRATSRALSKRPPDRFPDCRAFSRDLMRPDDDARGAVAPTTPPPPGRDAPVHLDPTMTPRPEIPSGPNYPLRPPGLLSSAPDPSTVVQPHFGRDTNRSANQDATVSAPFTHVIPHADPYPFPQSAPKRKRTKLYVIASVAVLVLAVAISVSIYLLNREDHNPFYDEIQSSLTGGCVHYEFDGATITEFYRTDCTSPQANYRVESRTYSPVECGNMYWVQATSSDDKTGVVLCLSRV